VFIQQTLLHWCAVFLISALAFTLPVKTSLAGPPEPDFLNVALGGYDVHDDRTAVEARLEYRSDLELSIFRPFTGFMATNDRSMYGYGGVLVDLFFGRRFVMQPSLAIGAYAKGSGKDLGHWIQFRTQLEMAWRFDDQSRLGLSLSHMSNAHLSSNNQGTEAVMLNYAVPFDRIAGKSIWE